MNGCFAPEGAGRSTPEHCITADGVFRNCLGDISMLDNLSVFEPKDINDRNAAFSSPRDLVNVKNDEIDIDEGTFYLAMRVI